jgi:hypothetical protein
MVSSISGRIFGKREIVNRKSVGAGCLWVYGACPVRRENSDGARSQGGADHARAKYLQGGRKCLIPEAFYIYLDVT